MLSFTVYAANAMNIAYHMQKCQKMNGCVYTSVECVYCCCCRLNSIVLCLSLWFLRRSDFTSLNHKKAIKLIPSFCLISSSSRSKLKTLKNCSIFRLREIVRVWAFLILLYSFELFSQQTYVISITLRVYDFRKFVCECECELRKVLLFWHIAIDVTIVTTKNQIVIQIEYFFLMFTSLIRDT